MKVLHINTESGFRGGERQVRLLALGLRDRGVEQLVIAREGGELAPILKDDGINVRVYTKPPLLGVRHPGFVRRVRKWAEEYGADIIHAHTGNAHTLALLAFGGRLPIVITRRVDFPVSRGFLSAGKYRRTGQHFIAISDGIRRVLKKGGVARGDISVVYSGIDADRVRGGDGTRLRREWLAGSDGPLVGFIGALVDHKAPWVLAEAAPLLAKQLPGARIVFIGDGPLRPQIEEIAKKHRPLIHLAGWRDDIADCYAALDLFCMPSKLEGLCTALIDALAAGVPCVATNAGGIPEVIEDGKTGILVPPLDAEALADSLAALWKDADRRQRFIEEGIGRVEKRFTAKAMVEGNMDVYTKVLGGTSR